MFMLNNKETSPVKAKVVQTSLTNSQVFFFENPGNKKTGVSPNGKTKILLNKHEGVSHNRIRSLNDEKLIMSGNSPVKSPYKNSIEAQLMKLDVKLIDLKIRADQDYKIYDEKGEVDENHYKFSRKEIQACIKQLNCCYKLSKDKEKFIKSFNRKVNSDDIYNPIALLKLYPKTGYEKSLAEEDFNHLLCKEDLYKEVPSFNLPPENSNKRKGFFDKQFLPRAVKMKMEKGEEKLGRSL